jgi:hypothetical protein
MGAFIELHEKFENLIYKVLVWIVLIPKTLLQIMLHPDWAPGYIKQELEEGGSKFDEYFSPIVLLLVAVLLVPRLELSACSGDSGHQPVHGKSRIPQSCPFKELLLT